MIHDGSDEVLAEFSKFGEKKSCGFYKNTNREIDIDKSNTNVSFLGQRREISGSAKFSGDTGTAARFFYCAKASKRDRDEGLNGFEPALLKGMNASPRENHGEVRNESFHRNNHPTVKPTALMRYLCKLITPTGGLILDPFTGSGSTGKAAMLEGFRFVGIELSPEYAKIARARISSVTT